MVIFNSLKEVLSAKSVQMTSIIMYDDRTWAWKTRVNSNQHSLPRNKISWNRTWRSGVQLIQISQSCTDKVELFWYTFCQQRTRSMCRSLCTKGSRSKTKMSPPILCLPDLYHNWAGCLNRCSNRPNVQSPIIISYIQFRNWPHAILPNRNVIPTVKRPMAGYSEGEDPWQ